MLAPFSYFFLSSDPSLSRATPVIRLPFVSSTIPKHLPSDVKRAGHGRAPEDRPGERSPLDDPAADVVGRHPLRRGAAVGRMERVGLGRELGDRAFDP